MTPGIALLVIGGILLVSGWTGTNIVNTFSGELNKRRKPNGSNDSNAPTTATPGDTVSGGLQLPKSFVPTHPTSGLPGYPAIDVFAKAGTAVRSPVNGSVTRISGQAGGAGGGGPYGWSIYVMGENGHSYFMTHFGRTTVSVGQKVKRGTVIGTVADYPDRPDHIHIGIH